jgi:hypothetical protein
MSSSSMPGFTLGPYIIFECHAFGGIFLEPFFRGVHIRIAAIRSVPIERPHHADARHHGGTVVLDDKE